MVDYHVYSGQPTVIRITILVESSLHYCEVSSARMCMNVWLCVVQEVFQNKARQKSTVDTH